MTEPTIEAVAQAARARRAQESAKRESAAAANRAWVAEHMPEFARLFDSLVSFRAPHDPLFDPFNPKVVRLEKLT